MINERYYEKTDFAAHLDTLPPNEAKAIRRAERAYVWEVAYREYPVTTAFRESMFGYRETIGA